MIVYFNQPGSLTGGGPSVWIHKAAKELVRRGHRVLYDNPDRADWAVAIIETGKLRRNKSLRILLRTDGIYNAEYNKLFNRAIRPDMTALHDKLKSDVPAVECVVYQSSWSRARMEEEIAIRTLPASVIHNGTDIEAFRPASRVADGCLNLLHVGKMRDGYLMRTLVAAYRELKQHTKCQLLLAGNMDAECKAEYKQAAEEGIRYLGPFSNDKLPDVYRLGDVFLGVRQGSSSDNVISEAQASGVPVVVPSWGGNVDMVKHEGSGMIVQTGHWAYDEDYARSIASAAHTISTDLRGFKQRAREHAVRSLSVATMIDKYLQAMGVK
jgi:glycosyltransferase involved in cell wall biosynthesis